MYRCGINHGRRESRLRCDQGKSALAGVAIVLLGLVGAGSLPAAASASRPASKSASRQMWRVADSSGKCVHHRGRISTAGTHKRVFGLVTIADGQCGNGQVVLSKRRHARHARWHELGIGSDWGVDPGRCSSDLKRIPLKVLRDFFGPSTCSSFSISVSTPRTLRGNPYSRCPGKFSFYNPKGGGYALILEQLRVHRVSCIRAAKIGGASIVGDPMPRGWKCKTGYSATSCHNHGGKRRFKFVFGGDAG